MRHPDTFREDRGALAFCIVVGAGGVGLAVAGWLAGYLFDLAAAGVAAWLS